MEAEDAAGGGGDGGRYFKADLTGAGVVQLSERVREKLREFVDDYTNNTLVEYVILLLEGGKRKDEAIKELDVFLGKDSRAFISWLWDHLSVNLHLYVQTQEQLQVDNKDDEAPNELPGEQKSSELQLRSKDQTHPERASEPSTTRSRTKRDWKGIGREGNENFPLRSVLKDILHGEEKRSQKVNEIRHPPSSNQRNGRKRDRDDEPQQIKRDLPLRRDVGASCRLLKFAVRDAVKAVQQTSSSTEPSSKRLRSVVSTSSADSLHGKRIETSTEGHLYDKKPERTRQILQVPGAALALRAAAEAAADSTKVRSTGSVFSRLGQGNAVNQTPRSREQQRDYEDFKPATTADDHDSDRYDNDDEISGDITLEDGEAEMNVDSTSDDDVSRDDGITRYGSSDSQVAAYPSVVEKKDVFVKCSVEPETSTMRHSNLIKEEQPGSSSVISMSKTVVVPVNANNLEPSNYETPKDVHVVEKMDITPMNATVTSLTSNIKELAHGEVQKDSQRSAIASSVTSSYSTAHPTEDADSRTLYVSNVGIYVFSSHMVSCPIFLYLCQFYLKVHFGATKDALSRHFNKFGAVLKVVIVTNAATGQPTGSAYVEFLHKESAERALSLNGTSFMARILKYFICFSLVQVVRRSSHEAAHFYGWPGGGRTSMYARHGRMAYPRGGLPGSTFRGRAPMIAGARSLQWKREPSVTDSNTGATVALPSAEQVLPPAT
uniref:RRM domain-containing protein n=1 Tax=Oryza glaberrima TaxID=4538 RepID=I1QJY3_ORYGL